ncbi:type II toxin-antitoxin system RelE/ParE family toxin [Leptolyngbya sp. NIES-2104]|uniref:type II toxin-antitoxin system RelE/ParE family toxin n=1 Tax=Leptolyngbya sp. NIES-2104 TaxID=1552121 RepID=UPI0006ECCD03|nr:type II toxin-antitoxin system RelE/ParE family toxin [Leptolyngbya sp. NIES-2104]GAP98369.1 hypothetical protein NIES2104_49240 [Leptolyngbya sp. NIES-2104]
MLEIANSAEIQIKTTAKFDRKLKKLAKRYQSIKQDLQTLLFQLQNGDRPGDKVAGANYDIFKVRIQNSDNQKGKSGGYRIIYYVQVATTIILVTVYAKSDQENISADAIDEIIAEFEQQERAT